MAKTEISIEQIKKLKELSGAGLTDAKKALVEAGGDFDKALEAMRKKGLTKAEKRGVNKVLRAAANTYVVSFALSLVYFLRYLLRFMLLVSDRD